MSTAATHLPPALKHGAYSTATLLPGEDKAEFDRLHQSLIAELEPVGALEEHIVANVARFVLAGIISISCASRSSSNRGFGR